MLVLIGLPVITKRMAPHRHPPPCRSNIVRSMKSAVEGVKSAMRRAGISSRLTRAAADSRAATAALSSLGRVGKPKIIVKVEHEDRQTPVPFGSGPVKADLRLKRWTVHNIGADMV